MRRSGGSAAATSMAEPSRARRSSSSGQTRLASQPVESGSVTSSGLRSTPARHATSGCRSGSGAGPTTRQVSSGAPRQRQRDLAGRRGPAVGVAVGIEAQAGARADLDQRERRALLRGDPGEERHEGREPADLVGLGTPLEDRRADRPVVAEQGLAEAGVRPRSGHPVPACGGEDDVGLALQRRQRVDPRQHLGVAGDPATPRVEAGRDVGGVLGEADVLLRDLAVGLQAQDPVRSQAATRRWCRGIPRCPRSRPRARTRSP